MAKGTTQTGSGTLSHDDAQDLLGPEVMTSATIKRSQANYKGNQHGDLVEITIEHDGKYVKAGDKLKVHPTAACIYKEMGLISNNGTPVERPKFENKDITVDA